MEINEIENYLKAGEIAGQAVKFARKIIIKGMPLIEIAEMVEAKIIELGGSLAFPINISLNEVAAHYTPGIDDKTIAEGLIKIDLGVHVGECIADTAFSLDLSDDKEYQNMIDLNEEALKQALSKVVQGTEIGEIGTAIQDCIEDYNSKNGKKYSIIKNLTGHSLGKSVIHAGLTIPNYRNEGRVKLKDVAIAIEPFITEGAGEVYEGQESEIFMLIKEGQARDKETRELLKFIKDNYSTRPFCRRWLEKKGFKKLGFSLSTLKNTGLLHNFPVLIEKSRMPVSQAEHTVLVNKEVLVTTK